MVIVSWLLPYMLMICCLLEKRKGLRLELKSQLSAKFEMKDIGVARYILGMEIIRDKQNIKLWLG